MDEVRHTRTVVVVNPQGLHARPADLLAKTANRYQAKIEIIKEGRRVDGKSILDMLTLGAECGTQLHVEASGPDAEQAVIAMAELFARGFPENENTGN